MQLLFVADPLEDFKTYKDTTFAMMREAARRGLPLAPLTDHLGGEGDLADQFQRLLDIGVRLNARR